MTYVPRLPNRKQLTPEHTESVPGITVHALKENKAPCGFVWPEAPPKPKRARKPPA